MQRNTQVIFVALALLVSVLLPFQPAYAANSTTGTTGTAASCPGGNGDAATTAFEFNGKGGSTGKPVCISDLITEVMKFFTGLAGLAVVVGIIIGGVRISLAQGNPGKLEQGIGAIVNSIVGLIVYILMYAIINFLVPGGIIR
jgi:hypothetical protein